MSPPLLGVTDEDEGESQMGLFASSASMSSLNKNTTELRERNYMGLSDSPSSGSSIVSPVSDESKICLNLKATELRLGLPGSQSPERDLERTTLTTVKPLFPLHPTSDDHCVPQKNVVSGNKRGFSDAMEGKFPSDSDINLMLSPRHSVNSGSKSGSVLVNLGDQFNNGKESAAAVKETKSNLNDSPNNNSNAPVSKAQVVGWPPVRSFRKNSLASTSKNADEAAGKASGGAVLVKVSMDGAPYLRKVDLKNYCKYQELSSALEKMFSCFTIGQYGSHEASGREIMSESNLKDLLHGSEYVLTYEDKDGDWLLVGDVPWVMFTNTCKKLRIMKGSDAIGLAPRAVEKCRNRN